MKLIEVEKEKSFMVPVKEIIENNYYLGINKYRIIDIEKKLNMKLHQPFIMILKN